MNKTILPPQQRFLAFIGLCLGIILTSFWGATFWGPIWGLLLPIPLLVLAFILRWMFFPRFSGRTRIQLSSLAAISAPALLYIPKNPFSLLLSTLISWISGILGVEDPIEPVWVVLSIQLVLTLGVISLNFIWHRTDVSQAKENPPKDATASTTIDQEYQQSLDRYCSPLIKFLDRYDDDVNWSDRDLTPLEAEVETERSSRLRPRIVRDLVSAIRRDRHSEVFVVLGDPGSGKSVSLRRLVRILCEQASKTGIVPVYINLREWDPELGEVTPESLVEFAKERAYEQTGRDGRAFLDTWYEPFRRGGRLFFVIDSFDELPAVLDCDDKSDLHRQVSTTFDKFFTQEIYSCRAVLASRNFRSPVGLKGTRLVIRPFRESQIRQAMKTWLLGRGINANNYIRQVFGRRPQLVPLLRNPFTAELIAEYARSGNGSRLPESMFAVFNHYISNRLYGDEPTFRRYGVTPDQVRVAAGQIAMRMYEGQDIGLEADIAQVTAFIACEDADSIIEALKYSRIVRVGGYNQRRFSFVHRRFAEFFVVDYLRQTPQESFNLNAIPTDSRWRDCLVMYCGVSELAERQRIAEFCWQQISQASEHLLSGNIMQARSGIHCLRFLNDAFRSDFEAIQNFRDPLGALVLALLKSEDPLLPSRSMID
ncbi:MAG: NACHT domain-containing protein [Cyanobacteria bacterium P01_F01_bin.150]